MRKKYKIIIKNTIAGILFLFLIILGASIIGDILYLIIKNRINKNLFFIIQIVLIFIMIELLFMTNWGKQIKRIIVYDKPTKQLK